MTAPVREGTAGAVRASPPVRSRRAILVRAFVIAALIGGFLSFIGAYDTDSIPLLPRTVSMIGVAMIATLIGSYAFGASGRLPWVGESRWSQGVVAAVLMTVPMAAAAFVYSLVLARLLHQHAASLSNWPTFLATSFVSSLFFCLLVAALTRRQIVLVQADQPAPPKFLERLPLKLRGAEVWAVEAEDHYLRLHTSKGQDLILLRLADAVAELEGIEGLQVHRSWWVARDAITEARRGDGRATLTLKDGSEVPVSRTYAAQLRQRRWI